MTMTASDSAKAASAQQGEQGAQRFFCRECSWRGVESGFLRAENPFSDEPEEMIGCPLCRDVNSMVLACDEPGCWRETSCGTPTPSGYRRTCSEHRPKSTPTHQQQPERE